MKKLKFDALEVYGFIETSYPCRVDPLNEYGLNKSKKAREEFEKIYPCFKLVISEKWKDYVVIFDKVKFDSDFEFQAKYYKALYEIEQNYNHTLQSIMNKIRNICENF